MTWTIALSSLVGGFAGAVATVLVAWAVYKQKTIPLTLTQAKQEYDEHAKVFEEMRQELDRVTGRLQVRIDQVDKLQERLLNCEKHVSQCDEQVRMLTAELVALQPKPTLPVQNEKRDAP